LASGNSHFAGISPRYYNNSLNYTYKFLPLTLSQVYAGRIGQSLKATDYIATDATACASSLKVMMDVIHLIKLYDFDRVIVLSVEDAVSNSTLEFFGEAKASLNLEQEKQGLKPSAFDNINHGFRVAQGAVLAVFEAERIAKTAKAELLGAYTASEECSNAIGQREDGQGFTRAIQGAMKMANNPKIEVIKTHGTGTLSNNISEKNGIKAVFDEFVATSLKPKIGHTMGVSGLLETCLLIDDMHNGFIPPILNRSEEDDVFLSKEKATTGGNILSISAGMGNVYSSAIFNTRV
jgi:3-oxoacyl-(acyl-carrier-protein) synthase